MTNIPLMPCTMKPRTSGNGVPPLSIRAASATPPPWIHLPSPATAQTITTAWMATSAATTKAKTRYAILMTIPPSAVRM